MSHTTVILSAAKDPGPRYHLRSLAALGMTVVVGPISLHAQDPAHEWARVIQSRVCVPADACPPRRGMVWDSSNAAPRYPEVLRAVGIGGDVELTFRVRPDGTVDPSSLVVQRASHQVFALSAKEAAPRWRFGKAAADAPTEPVPVQLHLLFAHEGACRGGASPQHVAWAAEHQLVIAACAPTVPRSQVSVMPDSIASRARRFDAPVTRADSLAIARQVVRHLLADRSRLPVGIVSDPQGSPWHLILEPMLAAEDALVPRSAIAAGGLVVTVMGSAGSATIEVGIERCEPSIGRLQAETRRYVPRVEQGSWTMVPFGDPLIASGKCPAASER